MRVSPGVRDGLARRRSEYEEIERRIRNGLCEKHPGLAVEIVDVHIIVGQATPIYDRKDGCACEQLKVDLVCHLDFADIAKLKGTANELIARINRDRKGLIGVPAIRLVSEITTREELEQEAEQLQRRLAVVRMALGEG